MGGNMNTLANSRTFRTEQYYKDALDIHKNNFNEKSPYYEGFIGFDSKKDNWVVATRGGWVLSSSNCPWPYYCIETARVVWGEFKPS